jgi:hypothetical protein
MRVWKYHSLLKRMIIFAGVVFLTATATAETSVALTVDGGKISIEFDAQLNSRVISRIGENRIVLSDFNLSEFINVNGKDLIEFKLKDHSAAKSGKESNLK